MLSAAIIISLLPFGWVPRLDAAFLLLFLIEFLLRALLIFRGEALYAHGNATGVTPTEAELAEQRGWQWPSTGTVLLLVLDLLALLSFVPAIIGIESAETRWLRLFRLSRMVLLLSYWAPLVRDVWSVMARQERAKQVVLLGFIVLALSFAGAVVIDQLHTGKDEELIDFDGDQIYGVDEHGEALDPDDERFIVHLWWAFRQIQDPGNMLNSPEQAAAVVVSLALTIFGLFMVSFLIGLGTDVVRELMEISRLRPPDLRGHTIVVNIDPSTQQLLHELIRYSRKLLPGGDLSLGWLAQLLRNTTQRGIRGARYLAVGRSHDAPDFLRQPALAKVFYRQAHLEDETFLQRTDVIDAQRVVLLADLDAKDPDAETIQALLTITESLREADEEQARRASLLFGLDSKRKRARLLIAEVLDESNVPAARSAITGDGRGQTRAFVVPSERLIALFVACIARRPGVGRLLEELLTSHGHELYTLFFDLAGLGYHRAHRPSLSDDPSEVMAELIRRARSLPGSRVVPVGVLMAGVDGGEELIVHINPEPDFGSIGLDSLGRGAIATELAGADGDDEATVTEVEVVEAEQADLIEADSVEEQPDASAARLRTLAADEGRCIGFVVIADNFGRVRELADDFYDRPRAALPDDDADETDGPPLCEFVCAPTARLERVLVCGFRSGTVSMVESLIQAEPNTSILLMVADEAAREDAFDDFDAHTRLVERGLMQDHHGRFEADHEQHTLTWLRPGEGVTGHHRPHVRVAIGDWSSSRQLTALPLGFGHVHGMDAVLLIAGEHGSSDARTAKTLMKLETLTTAPRIVAEVLDVELARRLRRRNAQRGDDRVHVYSIQELRAFFMFQSVVVPSFDVVYTELMGPWGESFVRMVPTVALTGRCSFEALSRHLSRDARVLVGVQLCEEPDGDAHVHGPGCRTSLEVAETDEDIDLRRLVDVWVISRDRS